MSARSPGVNHVKRFVFDGILATMDLQDLSRGMGSEASLIRTSTLEEATDPSWYPTELVDAARRSTSGYYRLFLFENKVRRLVERVLSESKGERWFDRCVPEPIRKSAERQMEQEGAARFHGRRGGKLLNYVYLTELLEIIDANWEDFKEVLYRQDWVRGKFAELRLTRNAVAHMGDLEDDDLDRLNLILRDWNRQVG